MERSSTREKRQARCPHCEQWSDIEWDSALPPGGWWWKGSADCPKCGYMALVESECEFRTVPRPSSRLSLRAKRALYRARRIAQRLIRAMRVAGRPR